MRSFALPLFLFISVLLYLPAQAAWVVTQTAVTLLNGTTTTAYSGGPNALGLTQINGQYLGRFDTGNILSILNGEVRSTVQSNDNFCSATLRYRVFSTCSSAPSYSTLPLTNFVDPAGTTEFFNLATNAQINLLQGLTESGMYTIEISWTYTGQSNSTSGCGTSGTDGNTPYRFNFEFRTLDAFSDGNFTANPQWSGNTDRFSILSSSDAAAGATNAQVLRLAGSGGATNYLSTPLPNAGADLEWALWMGRRATSLSSSNQVIIWLYANEANVLSSTVDGYRLIMGDDSGGDEINLQVVTNGVGTTILSSAAITNNITDWGATIRVVRNSQYQWSLRTSVLPTSSGTGLTAASCPISQSTVLHGTATNSVYTMNTVGHFGLACRYSSSSDPRRAAEFDNLIYRAQNQNTLVSLVSNAATVQENAGAYAVQLQLSNPSATTPTVVRLTRAGTNGAFVNGFIQQDITFPAGSTAGQSVNLTLVDNTVCNDNESITFNLSIVSGGQAAVLGTITSFVLNKIDNDAFTQEVYSSDFENENISGWNFPSAGAWTISDVMPLNDDFSLRHVNTSASGSSYAAYSVSDADLSGATTTWSFLMGTDFWEPTATTRMVFFLASNQQNLFGTGTNGYAVGVNQTSGSNDQPDFVTLWKVTNGQLAQALISTTVDWNLWNDIVAFEVTRSSEGLWTLMFDIDGDPDDLTNYGSVTDTQYTDFQFFGPRFQYSSSLSGKLLVDDIVVRQTGCQNTYYSQSTGIHTAAIWSEQPVGTPTLAVPNRFTNFVVQNGHTVSLGTNWVCKDLTIQSGSTLQGGDKTVTVHGNWTNEGTFLADQSTVVFDGAVAQGIGGATATRFFNLTSAGSQTVSANSPVEITGVLLPKSGVFQTNNQVTFISNADRDGVLGTISNGADVLGQIQLQRYIPPAPSYWVYLGSPILNQTLAEWNDDIVTTGFAGSDFPSYSFNSVYTYNEAVTGGRNEGWTAATNITNPMQNGRSHILYMNAQAVTLDNTGAFNKGEVRIPLSYNDHVSGLGYTDPDGWNLINNVYPAYIDWTAVAQNSGSFGTNEGTYYVYDTRAGNYRSYNSNSQVGTAGRYIPHSQGFFVKASEANQEIVFTEDAKSTTGSSFVRSEESSQFIRLSVARGNLKDEVALAFVDGATDNYDAHFDTQKWDSPVNNAPELALLTADEHKVTLDSRAALTNDLVIPVFVEMPVAGTYVFSVDEMQHIPFGTCLTIEDLVSGVTRLIEPNTTFSVVASAPYSGNRMIIRIGAPVSVSSSNPGCNGSADGLVIVIPPASGGWSWSMHTEMGTEVLAGDGTAFIEGMDVGHYQISVDSPLDACPPTSVAVSITEPDAIETHIETSAPLCNLGEEGEIEVAIFHAHLYDFNLVNADGDTLFNGNGDDTELYFQGLRAGIYSFEAHNGCETIRRTIDLTDGNAITATILTEETEIQITEGEATNVVFEAQSTAANDYHWSVNGVDYGSGQELTLPISVSGAFTVELIASNESCTATASVEIYSSSFVGVDETNNPDAVTWLQNAEGIWFSFHDVSAKDCIIDLYSSSGQLVHHEQGGSGQLVHIDLTNQASGTYTFKIWQREQSILTGRIFK